MQESGAIDCGRYENAEMNRKAIVLSVAKQGHVTQCLAVADLLGIEVERVIQARGVNKALPRWRRELDKLRWLVTAAKMAWNFRGGKSLIFSSGRSVLPATRLIKLLRGNNCLVLHIGSPKHWKRRCADVVLRLDHERVPGVEEDDRYPWNPTQVWVSAPICRSLPTAASDKGEATVLIGGLNITYGDDVGAYSDFLDKLGELVKDETVNIVFSRRTKAEVKDAVTKRFEGTGARLISAEDRDGFLTSCEDAGAFVVTPDSITMIAEACATGKPVYVADISVKRAGTRNLRFVNKVFENQQARVFEGKVDFERVTIERPDIDTAVHKMRDVINAWDRDPSILTA